MSETQGARRARLLERVKRLPDEPGVYLFLDAGKHVAYVGKARRLRTRVKSYFSSNKDARRAVRFVSRYVHEIDFISTESESAAFLLESKLVKRHKPPYNVKLRDDKDFLYVCVDRSHAFPALSLARRPKKKSSKQVSFHGPFANASALRRTMRMLGGIIPLRDCSDREFASRTRPCLKYEMKRCCAPCVDLVGQDEYAGMIAEAVGVLEGKCEGAVARLEEQMTEAAADMHYESAARHRDAIRYLRATTAHQQVENIGVQEADVVGLHRAGELVEVVVLAFRRGALVSTAHHTLESELPDGALLAGFVQEFYGELRPVPREILLPAEVPEASGLASFMGASRGAAVKVVTPKRGPRAKLVSLALRNAKDALVVAVDQRGHQRRLLEALSDRLGLPCVPEIIECYDISNTGRTAVVASRVVFRHGEPDRSRYRHYRMKTVDGQDDYASMKEVLCRRFKRVSTDPLPDLLVVDGGKGHLKIALEAAAESGVKDLPLASLAKGGRRGRAVTLEDGEQEHVFLPGRSDPLVLAGRSPEEYLLQRLRDEAHRFAIGHHRKARSKESLYSRLDDIPGVGPVLKKRLLQSFGGTRGLARASVEQIASVQGVSPVLAKEIADHLERTLE